MAQTKLHPVIQEHYQTLIGFTVKGLAVDDTDDTTEPFPVLIMEKDGVEIEVAISQDAEGNGPGFLFIESIETSKPVTNKERWPDSPGRW